MENWQAPAHQQKLAGLTVRNFGYDNTQQVEYQFNPFGFRSCDITTNASVISVGNSVSFGVGVDRSQTYVAQLSSSIGMPWFDLSYGCWKHENHDHLNNIKLVSKRDCDDLIVVQINNLDRRRVSADSVVDGNNDAWCVLRFCEWFDQCNELLKSKNKIWLYWDNREYNIPNAIKKQIAIYNKLHLDQSLQNMPSTFGPKSHSAVAKALTVIQKCCKVVQV